MTSRNTSFKWYAVVCVAMTLVAHGLRAQDIPESSPEWDRYVHIVRINTVDLAKSQPFLLRIDYVLYDLAGKLAGTGSAEESWGTGGRILSVSSPTLQDEDLLGDESLAKRTRESYLLKQVVKALLSPVPTDVKREGFSLDEAQSDLDHGESACFTLHASVSTDVSKPSYCADLDNRVLVVTGPLFVIRRENFSRSRNHEIPLDVSLSYEGRLAMTLHVTSLNDLPTESDGDNAGFGRAELRTIPSAYISATRLSKKEPSYPKQAKKKHIQGSVLLSALILKDGTLAGLDVIASPDPLLSQSAVDAVSTWTYEPYLLHGKPVEIDTAITVNYALGH
jgi:TonB family protein